jgi:hypothetical protein
MTRMLALKTIAALILASAFMMQLSAMITMHVPEIHAILKQENVYSLI